MIADLPCPHCWASGPRKPLGRVNLGVRVEEGPALGWDLTYSDFVLVERCSACQHLVVSKASFFEEGGELTEQQVLCNDQGRAESLPLRIRELWGIARRTRHGEPSAFATAARRTIEAVCKERGGRGRTLFHALDDCESRGLLGSEVVVLCHKIRTMGKHGAHDLAADVTPMDARMIDQLLETVLDEVYRRPEGLRHAVALVRSDAGAYEPEAQPDQPK